MKLECLFFREQVNWGVYEKAQYKINILYPLIARSACRSFFSMFVINLLKEISHLITKSCEIQLDAIKMNITDCNRNCLVKRVERSAEKLDFLSKKRPRSPVVSTLYPKPEKIPENADFYFKEPKKVKSEEPCTNRAARLLSLRLPCILNTPSVLCSSTSLYTWLL